MVSLRFAARAICERPLSRSPSLHHLVHVLECLYTLCNVSRYRPPTPPGSKYITPEGAKRLRDELDQLWHHERPRVTQPVGAIRRGSTLAPGYKSRATAPYVGIASSARTSSTWGKTTSAWIRRWGVA